ncbi:prepilin peptidase [Pseudodesulfovibrio sp.]|uniref:prepilin peptidase n=1 Tax=unclassified Pseudodesulfovibrio TaxID=2661612 RepID=UPI003B00F2D5
MDLIPRWIFYCIAGAAGLELGGLSTVFIRRWIEEKPLFRPFGSQCPVCGSKLQWRDTIPLLSYLLLRGKCRHCGAHIGSQYMLVEISCMAWGVALAQRFGPEQWPAFVVFLVLGCMLVAGSFIDIETLLLPDRITLGGTGLALAASFFLDEPGWRDAMAGAAVGAAFFWIMQQGYRLWRKEEGLGTGDIKLVAMIGAMTGLTGLPPTLLIAAVFYGGGMIACMLRQNPERRGGMIPFGPALALGGMIYILYSAPILYWWKSL